MVDARVRQLVLALHLRGGEEGGDRGSMSELVKRASGDSLNSVNLDLAVFS